MLDNGLNKILINASNLHSGGGVQVAVSFLHELTLLGRLDFNVIVSKEVHQELKSLNSRVDVFSSYSIYNTFGIKALIDFEFSKIILSHETVFTVFGPLYVLKQPKSSIVGFAQPWIIYPDNEIYKSYYFVKKVVNRLKYLVQKHFYFKSKKLVVELEHVKDGLEALSVKPNLFVVNNCISSVYLNREKWESVGYARTEHKAILLGIVTRDYPHKNLGILPDVAETLKKVFQINVKFLVTLTDKEWLYRDDRFKLYVDNVGPISVSQCPSFYNSLDGVIFPSLLECFSATPIESMMMKKPVFASDRVFVRQACGDFVNYFDPVDPGSIASSIADFFLKKESQRTEFVERASKQALKYNNPSNRAKAYIKIIEDNTL